MVVRLVHLSDEQDASLTAYMSFLEPHLIVTSSKERRSLAFAIVLRLARVLPAAHLPTLLSQPLVQSLASARRDKKHGLHQLAGQSIEELVNSVGTCDPLCYLSFTTFDIIFLFHKLFCVLKS